jgi:hypothetical protein
MIKANFTVAEDIITDLMYIAISIVGEDILIQLLYEKEAGHP